VHRVHGLVDYAVGVEDTVLQERWLCAKVVITLRTVMNADSNV